MLMRIYGELTFKREDALALLYAFSVGVIANLRHERKLRVFAEDLSGFTRQMFAIGYTAQRRRGEVWNIF